MPRNKDDEGEFCDEGEFGDGSELDEFGDEIDFDIVEKQQKEIDAYRKALLRIAKWFGEFPPTDRFYDEEKTRPITYAACNGSNGERDYMRQVARDALSEFETK